MGRKRHNSNRIEIKESDIPDIEIKILGPDYTPLGKYTLNAFAKKYGR